MSHSPAPWTAIPADHCSPIDLFNPEPDYWYIDGPGADVHGIMGPDDAYLIAAAPDLLAALHQAHMALIGYLPAHRNAVTDAAISAAKAAIAKATRGKS